MFSNKNYIEVRMNQKITKMYVNPSIALETSLILSFWKKKI